MLVYRRSLVLVLLVALLGACSSSGDSPGSTPAATQATELPATTTPAPLPGPQPVRQDILASRLSIPSLGIDAEVQKSQTVPDTSVAPQGCPPRPSGEETLSVPDQGIATPANGLEGLENKAWIFGHSRWQGRPGIFFSLQDVNLGDELFIDGVDRTSGRAVARQRFVVNAIYLSDTDSGAEVIVADSPRDIPLKPQVILQTSVREDGAGKQWILNQQKLLAKSTNLVKGSLDDPCKYLLLFVVASQG